MSDIPPGRFILGITGNIGSGKSLVLKMLEQKGAFIIDADAISRRVTQKDAPAYQPIVQAFGDYVLDADGQIDRNKLGRIAFADADAMRLLESIIHPLVRQAIHTILENLDGPQELVAIEAVKLLEGPLRDLCAAVWVVSVPAQVAQQRLVSRRGLSEADARQRIAFQGDDAAKRAQADLVIDNSGSPGVTWKQVSDAHARLLQAHRQAAALAAESPLRRYRPGELPQLDAFIEAAAGTGHAFVPTDDRAFWFYKEEHATQAVAGWYAENFIARVTHLFALPNLAGPALQNTLQSLLGAVEAEATHLRCEALLLALPASQTALAQAVQQAGLAAKSPSQLGIRAWADAARAMQHDGAEIYYKQLGGERVLKPL